MIRKISGLLAAVIFTASIFAGCGAKKAESAMNEVADTQPSTRTESKDAVGISSLVETGAVNQSTINPILAQRKMIRNANITVEVDDFDIAYGKIKSIILNIGIVQESTIKKEKIYIDSKEKLITKGIIIIRVEKEKFDEVLSGIRGLGLLIDENIRTDDVTDKFYDTESRLRLLRYEENRLEQYLKSLTDPDIIFKTESRLTDIRHEIESLTGTLKKMNDLIELSTITINMNEKSRVSIIPVVKDKSFWGRLSGGFLESLKGVAGFCGDLMIFLAQALPVLVLLGVFVLIALAIYRRFSKKNIKKDIKKDTSGKDVGMS